jgi:2-desacetyl-2-hydroxyethyl bacteriochlorophyllide A dehydrogenase
VRAVALVAPGEVRVVDDWPEPECGPGDVVVRVRAVGLCGTDLAVYGGKRAVPGMPWVMGHEGGGDIVAVGSEVRDREVGQRVVIEPNVPDGTCPMCRAGRSSACKSRGIVGVTRTGILADRVVVPAPFAWPVAPEWSDEALACFEPLVVAYTAVMRAGVRAGDECLVVGAGSQGLLVCQSLLAVGAHPFVTEPHEGRLALAEKLGARRSAEHVGDFLFVFETSGAPPAWEPAFAAVGNTGTMVVIGQTATPLPIVTNTVVQRQITIRGTLIYDHPQDYAAALQAVSSGAVAAEATVQAGFSAEDAADAFAGARDVPGKSWISMA